MSILELLATEAHITVNKALIRVCGLHEAILLGSLCGKQVYWKNREECMEDGFFFCTAEYLEKETTLSPYQQKKAFDNLEKQGLIETKITGIPAKKYFKVVESKLLSFLKASI